jgi:anti-sigma regulatory factor (Ser/Thr protein kinase)
MRREGSAAEARRDDDGFRHEALFHAGDDGYLEDAIPFVEDALDGGGRVMVAVSPEKIELMKAELDGRSDRVRFVDMRKMGVNPGGIISAWRDFAAERPAPDVPLWGIGEPVWPERSADELAECHRHECLINVAFDCTPNFTLLCPYDTDALSPDAVENARVSHPVLVQDAEARQSDLYGAPATVPELLAEPLPEPEQGARELDFDSDGLPTVRRFVSQQALDAGFRDLLARDLVLAVSEVAANSTRHAGGAGTLRVWRDQDALVCEVADRGRIADPLVGRLRPPSEDEGGYGLWLVNQLCGLVQVRSSNDGTVVRLRMSPR